MNKTKIDWCESSFNPISGCYHNCQYCYARGISTRFSGKLETTEKIVELDERIYGEDGRALAYPYGFKPTFHKYRLNEYVNKQRGRSIFVCSMADLFGDWIPNDWIKQIFDTCRLAKQHNYLFLTKNPKRYYELLSDGILKSEPNMWFGASVTNAEQLKIAVDAFGELPYDCKTFISVEPLLEDITLSDLWLYSCDGHFFDWVIIGAETGNRKDKVVPKKEWVKAISNDCKKYDITVFMKSSLEGIVPTLICNYPWDTN